jgi:hypothetical protein
LFHEINSINTDWELHNFQYMKDKFIFAIDLTEGVNLLNSRIAEYKSSISKLVNELSELKQTIWSKLYDGLINEITLIDKEIVQLNDDLNLLSIERGTLTTRIISVTHEKISEVEKSKNIIELKAKEQQSKIMKEKKGLYTFEWKHERKSWQAANSIIYFDIGAQYLFEKSSDGLFKKITISEFLKQVNYDINCRLLKIKGS